MARIPPDFGASEMAGDATRNRDLWVRLPIQPTVVIPLNHRQCRNLTRLASDTLRRRGEGSPGQFFREMSPLAVDPATVWARPGLCIGYLERSWLSDFGPIRLFE